MVRHFRMLRRLACGGHAVRKALVGIAALALFAVASEASAQTSPSSQLRFPSWIKFCKDVPLGRECTTAKDAYANGELIASIAITKKEGGSPRFLLSVPDGFALQQATPLTIDGDEPRITTQ